MTRNVAVFDSVGIEELILTLSRRGYTLANPATAEIRGWDSTGELVLLPSPDEALAFLTEGRGIQLWRSASEDVFLSVVGGRVHVSFDGFTDEEEAALIHDLSSAGIHFRVLHEDDPLFGGGA